MTAINRAEMLQTAYENARENMWTEHREAGRPAVGSGHRFVEPDDRDLDAVLHQVCSAWDNLGCEAIRARHDDPAMYAFFVKEPAPTLTEVKALHWPK